MPKAIDIAQIETLQDANPPDSTPLPHVKKRVLVPIANGSDSIETACIVSTLCRFGAKVVVASVIPSGSLKCKMSCGLQLLADTTISDAAEEKWDLIALPGGPGVLILRDSATLISLLKKQALDIKLCGAVGSAPAVILAPTGLVSKGATCYPSPLFLNMMKEASGDAVVRQGNVVTSMGPGTALEFSVKLGEILYGKERANIVAHDLLCPGYFSAPRRLEKSSGNRKKTMESSSRPFKKQKITVNKPIKTKNHSSDEFSNAKNIKVYSTTKTKQLKNKAATKVEGSITPPKKRESLKRRSNISNKVNEVTTVLADHKKEKLSLVKKSGSVTGIELCKDKGTGEGKKKVSNIPIKLCTDVTVTKEMINILAKITEDNNKKESCKVKKSPGSSKNQLSINIIDCDRKTRSEISNKFTHTNITIDNPANTLDNGKKESNKCVRSSNNKSIALRERNISGCDKKKSPKFSKKRTTLEIKKTRSNELIPCSNLKTEQSKRRVAAYNSSSKSIGEKNNHLNEGIKDVHCSKYGPEMIGAHPVIEKETDQKNDHIHLSKTRLFEENVALDDSLSLNLIPSKRDIPGVQPKYLMAEPNTILATPKETFATKKMTNEEKLSCVKDKNSVVQNLFDYIVLPVLFKIGWKSEQGDHINDRYFLPPGVVRGNRRSRNNRDFFDSRYQVFSNLEQNKKWTSNGEIRQCCQVYSDCVSIREKIISYGQSPSKYPPNLLVRELKENKGIHMLSSLETLKKMAVKETSNQPSDVIGYTEEIRDTGNTQNSSSSFLSILEDISLDMEHGFPAAFFNNDLPNKYGSKPGITKWQPFRMGKRRRESFASSADAINETLIIPDEDDTRYRARITHKGSLLQLGAYHSSSTYAAATIDLANLALTGTEDLVNNFHVLSSAEAWVGLKAAGFSEREEKDYRFENIDVKEKFEEGISKALRSLGGEDDFLAHILLEMQDEKADSTQEMIFKDQHGIYGWVKKRLLWQNEKNNVECIPEATTKTKQLSVDNGSVCTEIITSTHSQTTKPLQNPALSENIQSSLLQHSSTNECDNDETQNPSTTTPLDPNSKSESRKSSGRRKRCKICAFCLRKNCGKCICCKDMPSFGGKGRKRQACQKRECPYWV